MPRKRSTESGNPSVAEGAAPAAKPVRRRKSLAAAAGAASHATGTYPADFSQSEREEVERLAYDYWQARGGHHGSPDDDWFRAEEEVRRRRSLPSESNGRR